MQYFWFGGELLIEFQPLNCKCLTETKESHWVCKCNSSAERQLNRIHPNLTSFNLSLSMFNNYMYIAQACTCCEIITNWLLWINSRQEPAFLRKHQASIYIEYFVELFESVKGKSFGNSLQKQFDFLYVRNTTQCRQR